MATHLLLSLDRARAVCGAPLSGACTLLVERATCPACLRWAVPTAMPEALLLEAVRALGASHGWLTYHTHRSDRSEKGWFDLALAKPGHPLHLAELKSAKGKLTLAQQRWATTVAQSAGVQVHCWRPGDLHDIAALLGGHG